jgi:hypothetical protein
MMRSRISGGSDEIVVLLLMVDLSDVSEDVLSEGPHNATRLLACSWSF